MYLCTVAIKWCFNGKIKVQRAKIKLIQIKDINARVKSMLIRKFFILWFAMFLTPVFAGSWGGYVNHEGASKAAACYEAKKHANKLCEKNGETFNIKDSSVSCKIIKTAMHNNNKIYFVNLVFYCHDRTAKVIKGSENITE